MRPSVGRRKPVIAANSVVLPAPFGPISAVMRPVAAVKDARSMARRPPKFFETFSTRSRGSAMAALRHWLAAESLAQRGDNAGDSSGRESHHDNQHTSVNDEIEARCVTSDELGHLAERADHECAEQR